MTYEYNMTYLSHNINNWLYTYLLLHNSLIFLDAFTHCREINSKCTIYDC